MIDIIDSPNVKQWSEFIYNHPHGNIFQTPEMTHKRTKESSVTCCHKNDETVMDSVNE